MVCVGYGVHSTGVAGHSTGAVEHADHPGAGDHAVGVSVGPGAAGHSTAKAGEHRVAGVAGAGHLAIVVSARPGDAGHTTAGVAGHSTGAVEHADQTGAVHHAEGVSAGPGAAGHTTAEAGEQKDAGVAGPCIEHGGHDAGYDYDLGRRKSVGERVSELERGHRANLRSKGVADMKQCNKSPVYKTIWRSEDETLVRKLAKNVIHKKWEIVKICLNVIDEISCVVK